ncbi:hypothetical protein BKA61DRAFT_736913 [Leptodontidium sp. MPI-SDFR-AT-0119]|nr:hypothetical protein BKA61DRAFT_736913 [Leptodontidium sp. MPI-SDFR-AT-0119]
MSRSLNPGSCESCKRKKCKCDRKLPICGQCAGVVPPISCTYVESNRRGIPGGYVGALEARLIETEVALYKTICSLRSSSANPALDLSRSSSETLPEALLQHEQGNESKVLKMATWKRLPLSTVEEVQSWWDTLRAESGMVCVDQTQEQLDTSNVDHREVPRAEPGGEMSFEPENGTFEDPNANDLFQGETHSHMQMQRPLQSDQHVPWSGNSELGIPAFGADDTGQHGRSSTFLIDNPMSGEQRSRPPSLPSSSQEEITEMGRPQRLSAIMSHIYY